ncbi:MAG: MATE family efflux transporter [Phycisphaerales bacterium]|nr:MATE family efflux transporter [Phycisphaerales bacterium]
MSETGSTDPTASDEPKAKDIDGDGRIQSGKLAGRTMWSAIWILALPVLLQQTLTAFVGLVDKMFGGSMPEDIVIPALDGLSVGSFIGWLISIAMSGLGIGAQALIARAIGAGEVPLAQRAVGSAITIAFAWGAVVGVALWFMIEPLCQLVELDPEATRFAREYVQVLSFSMPFCSVMMVASMCLFGAGETVWPSVVAVFANVVNIVGSFLCSGIDLRIGETVITNPSPVDPMTWGVQGIAMGTALSWIFGAAAMVILLLRGVRDLQLLPKRMRFDGEIIWRIVRVGVPTFFEGLAMWLANFVVLRFIGDIAIRETQETGDAAGLQGAHIIAIQWEAFSFLPGFAMGTAAGALAGQYLGAGNTRLARRAMLACTLVAMVIMGSLGVVFMAFGEPLTRVISDQAVHLEVVPMLLFICGAAQIFFAITMVLRQGLRGVGDTRWTFLLTVISSYGVRLPMAWYLGVQLGYGLAGVWIALCGEIVIRAMLFLGRFLHGGWARIEV